VSPTLKLSKRAPKRPGRNTKKYTHSQKPEASPKERKKGRSAAAGTGTKPQKSKSPGHRKPAPGDAGNTAPAAANPVRPVPAKPVVRERRRAGRIDVDEPIALESALPPVIKARPVTAPLAPLFAICGRPNVGKSTLFNKLTESRRSIVGDEPGITRDRIYGEVNWDGKVARVVDTGGIVPDDEALIPSEIYRQARIALEEAECIVMVVDGRTELASPDFDLAKQLLRSGKTTLLAVNKIDTEEMRAAAENYRKLGFKTIIPISAEHSIGFGDLLDDIFEHLTFPEIPAEPEAIEPEYLEPPPTEEYEAPIHRTHGEFELSETKVAIIGRPNVGKSTLLNALTGSSRAIVSPVAGTTRDAVDEVLDFEGSRFRIVDTAGIRRKGKTTQMAEKMSVVMAIRHLEAADLALLVIDATEGVTAADATIGGYAHESGRSVIVVINKWDLVTTARADGKPPADREVFEEQVRHALKYLNYAPVIFISAASPDFGSKNLGRVLSLVKKVATERRKRVTTGQMNRFLERVDFERATVPMSKRLRIYYMTQAAVAPPTFILFTNRQIKLHFSFERFLENQVREAFGFEGSPIWFKVRARSEKKDKS
jgi:GTPase